MEEAAPGDVVVIAGKGHETYQELADRTIPFDDRAVAEEELRDRGRTHWDGAVIERRLSEIASAVHGTLRGIGRRRVLGGDGLTRGRARSPVRRDRGRAPGWSRVRRRRDLARGRRRARGSIRDRRDRDRGVRHGRALLDLAADERDRMTDTRVLGITGANGKTSVEGSRRRGGGRASADPRQPGVVQQRGRAPDDAARRRPRSRSWSRRWARDARGTFGCSARSRGPTPSS